MSIQEDPKDQSRRVQALGEIEKGKDCVSKGDLPSAKNWFQKSMDTHPTAEGFTYFAWMLSFEGKFDEAIELCKEAIKLDEEFGNPYNDIGAYFVAKGLFDDAIPWLERAKLASRYEARHFPYTNLGRIYLQKGWLKKAQEELREGLRVSPESDEIRQLIDVAEKELQ